MNIEYGIEDGIARQKRREIREEVREARLARLARTSDEPSRIRAFIASALHSDHNREKEA